MRIVIAPDSFKESMSSEKAGQAIACGIQAVVPDAECHVVPMSDGGEGFTDAIAHALNASLLNVPVTDAVGRKSLGQLAVSIPSSSSEGVPTAVIEVASAVGLDGVAPADRNPMKATSRGVGELIERAMDEVGPSGRINVGLGGSATNDAGAGMLAQLGARFVTRDGNAVAPLPERFHEIAAVDLTGLDKRIRSVCFEIASDVSNPLLGDNGASAVFGPQKGADPAMVKELDLRLATLLDAFEANGESKVLARALNARGRARPEAWAGPSPRSSMHTSSPGSMLYLE